MEIDRIINWMCLFFLKNVIYIQQFIINIGTLLHFDDTTVVFGKICTEIERAIFSTNIYSMYDIHKMHVVYI